MSYSMTIDRVISNMSTKTRILYLQSDCPDVLEMVLDKDKGSSFLRTWLGIDIEYYKGFRETCKYHAARPLLSVYEEHSSYGILKGDEYYKKQRGIIDEVISLKSDIDGKCEPVYYCCGNERFCLRINQIDKGDINKEEIRKSAEAASNKIDLSNKMEGSYILGDHILYCKLDGVPANISTVHVCKFFYLTNADALDTSALARMLQAFLENEHYRNAKLILTGTTRLIPSMLADQIQLIRLGAPSVEDIQKQLKERPSECQRLSECRRNFEFSDEEIKKFAGTLSGLTYLQLENIYASFGDNLAYHLKYTPGALSEKVWCQKKMESEKDGILDIDKIEENPGVVGIGGFERWLNENLPDLADPSTAEQFGSTPPRGLIISGVPGTGKSKLAKQMAYQWNQMMVKDNARPVSFIKFDIGRISSDKYGESEAKMERFLARISEQEPAVLLVDEVEKTFYQDKKRKMHEVKEQLMAMLLFWLQEHKENIFTFMTSNDISILPTELIRSKRLSERFFVFLPGYIELMCMVYSFLRSKPEKNIYSDAFNTEIKGVCAAIDQHSKEYGSTPEYDRQLDNNLANAIEKGSLCNVLTKLTDYAKENARRPFMTGADMEDLVEKTNQRLRREKPNLGWTGEDFANAMIQCCCCDEFRPYAQSNMNKLVEMYLSCDYNDVSAHPLLPRVQFIEEDGRFVRDGDGVYIRGTAPKYAYDQYLQELVARKIEEAASREKREKDRQDRQDRLEEAQESQMEFQSEQMTHQREQWEFQSEQMERQRAQWEQEDQDEPSRKQYEENARTLQELQIRQLQQR